MSDILTEISRFVEPNATPNQFMKSIDKIFVELDKMETFTTMNVEGSFKKVLLNNNQNMRERAVLSAEVFQEFVNQKLKEE